jgi:hypothetical protein
MTGDLSGAAQPGEGHDEVALPTRQHVRPASPLRANVVSWGHSTAAFRPKRKLATRPGVGAATRTRRDGHIARRQPSLTAPIPRRRGSPTYPSS